MLEPIEKLLILQHRDQCLRDVTQALQQLPQEKKSCEQGLILADQKLELVRNQQRELEKQIRNLENDIASKKTQIARYRTQQMETRKNEEYAALHHEIELTESAILALEERQLLLMEQLEESLRDSHRALEVNILEHKRLDAILSTIDARAANLSTRQQELQEERPRFMVNIDETLLERYERLFKSKQGIAVASIEHGVCTGCRMQMTTQTLLSAKAEKEIVYCSQCGRFLYTEED